MKERVIDNVKEREIDNVKEREIDNVKEREMEEEREREEEEGLAVKVAVQVPPRPPCRSKVLPRLALRLQALQLTQSALMGHG